MTHEPDPLDAIECGLSAEEALRLRTALQSARQATSRSSQHESWAWTRLQASLQQTSTPSATLVPWRWAAAASLVILMAVLFITGIPSSSTSTIPVAETQNPKVWASGFHFADAQADVIWANGYDYIPASFTIK